MYTLKKKTDFKGLTNFFPSHYFFLEFLLNLGCTKSPLAINGVITLKNGRKQMGNWGSFTPITYLELVFWAHLVQYIFGRWYVYVKKKKHPKSQHPDPPPNQTPPVCQETKATNSTQVFRHSWPMSEITALYGRAVGPNPPRDFLIKASRPNRHPRLGPCTHGGGRGSVGGRRLVYFLGFLQKILSCFFLGFFSETFWKRKSPPFPWT